MVRLVMGKNAGKVSKLLALSAAGLLAGCGVQRQMKINSNPDGALVVLNGEEVGRTPLTHDFLWYGKYDVEVRKEGYQTLTKHQNVTAPWWQWVPFDFVAELVPLHLTDKHTLSYSLTPASTQPADAQVMLRHAEAYRDRLEGVGAGPTTRPEKRKATTKPTSGPTTKTAKK